MIAPKREGGLGTLIDFWFIGIMLLTFWFGDDWKMVNGRKIKNTTMYHGSPYNPRVLQSSYAVRDFIICVELCTSLS